MRFPACLLAVLVTSSFARAQAPVGSDDCATAAVLTGADVSVPFYTGFATTGAQGQGAGSPCSSGGQIAMLNDLWYAWTAPQAGRVAISTCGQTLVNTKLAVYDSVTIGGTCPAASGSGSAIACNDDMSSRLVQSRVLFDAFAGTTYVIQLGSSPNVPLQTGSGTLTIHYPLQSPVHPYQHDDGSSDDATLHPTMVGGDQGVLQTFGELGVTRALHGVSIAYGTRVRQTTSSIVDGAPVRAFVFDDPNEDGDPADAVLLSVVDDFLLWHDTDQFNYVPFPQALTVDGRYFIGWSIQLPTPVPPSYLPFGFDISNCDAGPGESFFMANAGQLDLNVLANNARPPAAFAPAWNLTPSTNFTWMVRPEIGPSERGEPFCSNDTALIDHTAQCPCGNSGAIGRGCANSFEPRGAEIHTSGSIAHDDVQLVATGLPATAFTLMIQHANAGDGVFHDGVLCAANPMIRLRGRAAVAGRSEFPSAGIVSTMTLSARGGTFPGSGAHLRYAAWYRNVSSTFCPPATSNVTNGWLIVW